MAISTENKNIDPISSEPEIKTRTEIHRLGKLEDYIDKNFMMCFAQTLRNFNLEADSQAIIDVTYALLRNFHGAHPKTYFSLKYLQAAGIRAIVNHGLRTGRYISLRNLCSILQVGMKFFRPFPPLSPITQIDLICDTLQGKVQENVITTTKRCTGYFYKLGMFTPATIVGIALYHASMKCHHPLSLTQISDMVRISPSNLYSIRNRFPTIP
ncbi:MAG: hypothetical protein E4G98_04940 [Promethearchaeota archaeon]|nr:MAG: hypothetical protein E4G98_04940 [Candidatus Lokiarchaeota archaeon]